MTTISTIQTNHNNETYLLKNHQKLFVKCGLYLNEQIESLRTQGKLPETFPKLQWCSDGTIKYTITIRDTDSLPICFVCSLEFGSIPKEESYVEIVSGNIIKNTLICLLPITQENYKETLDELIKVLCKTFISKISQATSTNQ